MTRTTTISMTDRVEQIREQEVPPREEQIEEIREQAAEFDDPWKIPDDLERRYERLQRETKNLRGEANTLEHYAEEWGEDVFEIRELSAGGVGMIQDDVAEASGIDVQGGGTPKGGYARVRATEVAVKSKPDDAPEIEDMPDAVVDWLYDCIDEFNTTGEVALGNFSLRAEMIKSGN